MHNSQIVFRIRGSRFSRCIGATWTLLALLACTAAARGALPLLVEGNFEEGSIATQPPKWNISKAGNGQPSIVTEPVRAGRYALKNTVTFTSKADFRSELRAITPNPVWGEDTWYGFSIYYPPDTAIDMLEEIVAQWHANPYGQEADAKDTVKNPPLALCVAAGKWSLRRRSAPTQPTTNESSVSKHYTGLGEVENGTWTDWVFRVRWHWLPEKGQLQVWKNGVEVVNDTGGVGNHDVVAPYFKLGMYKHSWRGAKVTGIPAVVTRTVYHDEFRMAGHGARYEDVAPGGGR